MNTLNTEKCDHPINMTDTSLKQTIQQQANQCVKCGLCLPHCPTYVITENECESPRGRIAIMDALAKEQIPLTEKSQRYLDHCLTCRACEAVCPAKVSYGDLIDNARELITQHLNPAKKIPLPAFLLMAIKHPVLLRLGAHLITFYQKSGLQKFARKAKILKSLQLEKLDAVLSRPTQTTRWHAFLPASMPEQGRVALFIGCINQLVDQETIKATIKVVTACGYGVYVPNQTCCGALHQHAGFNNEAKLFAENNLASFTTLPIDHIITITSGCAATLQEYTKLIPAEKAASFCQKIIDISEFLLKIEWPAAIELKPLAKHGVLHTPCTLRNVLKQSQAPNLLLRKIPNLQITTLTNSLCCGAAGAYMLAHSDMANALLEKTIQQISPLKPDYLLTSNIGCALQIYNGLNTEQNNTPVLHPIVLIAQQIK